MRSGDVVAPDEFGPALAAAGVLGVACLVLTLTLLTHLDGAGRKRRWSRARVVEVSAPETDGTTRSGA